LYSFIEEGKKAPAFKGIDQNGKPVSLADYKGKKLVLYFYPKDSTPTCTVQACNIRDNFSALKKAGIHIIGISADDVKSHKKFEEKHQLPFTIIADTERAIIDKFGVWGEKQLYGKKYMGLLRTSFLINEKGVIVKVIEKPKSKQHAEEILEAWQSVDQ
jgi:peroxiredoxin Q/BCP